MRCERTVTDHANHTAFAAVEFLAVPYCIRERAIGVKACLRFPAKLHNLDDAFPVSG
jgi:hypothetical protein